MELRTGNRAMTQTRYVILHHRDDAGEHWDFMIEQTEILVIWKLRADPTAPDALPVEGIRIQDHRKEYLEYEGPISGDRGHVTQTDAGRCDVSHCGDSFWRFELRGQRMAGRF